MNKIKKQQMLEELRSGLGQSEAAFLVGVQGLSVAEVQGLRRNLRQAGAVMHVAKNTLVKIAVHDNPGMSVLEPYCKNQLALVLVKNEAPAAARAIHTFSREHEKLNFVAGVFQSHLVDRGQFGFLATLPSHDVLVAQFCGLLKAPIARLAFVLARAAEKKQQEQ